MITAGAGMGVDSGLPDFRGNEGFWQAYPPYRHLGLDFPALADPRWFTDDPSFAWGFYGHRQNLYRATPPHAGFEVLRRWSQRIPTFVYTSNVDGAFQKAGFSETQVMECHGSIHWLQSLDGSGPLHDASGWTVNVDPTTFRAKGKLPRDPKSRELLRPNILMFGDGGWSDRRTHAQKRKFTEFLRAADCSRLVVVECGAGQVIPTVRRTGEALVGDAGDEAVLIRINKQADDARVDLDYGISLTLGAKAALEGIESRCDVG